MNRAPGKVQIRLAAVLVLTCVTGWTQTISSPAVSAAGAREQQTLAQIKSRMADNLARLPNYTCGQTVERSHRDAHKKRFERQDLVRLEVAMAAGRELYSWPGAERIDEEELGKLVQSGVSGSGDFGMFARAIFLTAAPEFSYRGEEQALGHRAVRFDYRVPALYSEYSIRVNQQQATVAFHGSFWADAETLDLLLLEVKADNIPRALNLERAEDTIGFARTRIGNSDFLLPQDSEVTLRDLAGNESRNHTVFAGCRQFTGESVLSFGEAASATAPPAAVRTAVSKRQVQMPIEFQVYGGLETPIRGDTAAVGDALSIRLRDGIKQNGEILAPKGSIVRGRVTRAEHVGGALLLRFSFDSIEFDNGHADLRGRRIHCSVFDAHAPNSLFRGETDGDTMVFSADRLILARGFGLSLTSHAGEADLVKKKPPPVRQEPVQTAAKPAPPPTQSVLRADTTAVVVDVIVTDRKGRHVAGLSAGDFKIYEENAPQTIVSFTPPAVQPNPGRTNGGRTAIVSGASNQPAVAPREQTPQLVTLVIDLGDLHSDSLKRACAAAARFVKKTIAAGNAVSVYSIDSSLHLVVPFNRDRQKILDAIEKLSGRVPAGPFTAYERESAENELDASRSSLPRGKNDPGLMQGSMLRTWITIANALQARAVFVALRALAMGYRQFPGRKSIIVFSEGFLHGYDSRPGIDAVVDAANRANVAIYVIDALGMSINSPDRSDKNNASAEKGTYTQPDSSPDIFDGPPDRATGGMNQFDWMQTLGTDRHGDLAGIATATGGFLVQDTNDLGAALDRVNDDASEFYTLVYSPANRNYDGAYRKIRVELSERGYHVRHRRGYWALPPGQEVMLTPAAAQLLALAKSGDRKPSFAPRVNAVLVPVADGFGVATAVSMPGKLVRFEKLQNQYVAGVTVLLVAYDESGRLVSVHERNGDLRFAPKEHATFSEQVFNWQGHLVLPEMQPVMLQAIVRFADGTLGISETTQVNPGSAASNLRLTGLVLTDRAENSACTPSPTEPLCLKGERLMLPAEPLFQQSTTMEVYCTVLGVSPKGAKADELGAEFRIGSRDGWSAIQPKSLVALPGRTPRSYGVVADFDLRTLAPGQYTLEMTATDPIQQSQATQRTEFAVQ